MFAFVVVVAGVDCVNCRLSSVVVVVVVVRFGLEVLWPIVGLAHVYRESTLDPRRSPLLLYLVLYHHHHHLLLLNLGPYHPNGVP